MTEGQLAVLLHTIIALAVLTSYTILTTNDHDAEALLGLLIGQGVGAGISAGAKKASNNHH